MVSEAVGWVTLRCGEGEVEYIGRCMYIGWVEGWGVRGVCIAYHERRAKVTPLGVLCLER